MASALDLKRLGLGLGATALMAALIWFGTGLHPFWPLMWFAPLPVLLFANRASWWSAALAAASGAILGILNLWPMFHGMLHMPLPILLQIYLSEGIAYALAVSLYRALLQRGAYRMAVLAFPALIVSFEFFLNLTSPHGTAGNLAYSQLRFLPFLQLASITGPWGMSFLLLSFSTALSAGLYVYPAAPKLAAKLTGAVAVALVLVLGLGAWRLHEPVQGPQVKVGLASSDLADNIDTAGVGAPTSKLFQDYSGAVEALAARGAQVVVLPEKLGVVREADLQATDDYFQKLVDRSGAGIVVGMIRVAKDLRQYNEARVYLPGKPPQSYDKEHMLPPFESDLTPGATLTLLPHTDAVWGVQICKDLDFTPLSADYGKKSVGLMLVPGWDFVADWIFHGHMAIMRGVESGFSVVRSAKGGSLYVSDDRGRVLAEVKSDSAPFATLSATVPAGHDETIYDTMGDWFAYLSLLSLLALVVRLGMLWKRPAAA
jgi:apolipoprotein N-acyltransferase